MAGATTLPLSVVADHSSDRVSVCTSAGRTSMASYVSGASEPACTRNLSTGTPGTDPTAGVGKPWCGNLPSSGAIARVSLRTTTMEMDTEHPACTIPWFGLTRYLGEAG